MIRTLSEADSKAFLAPFGIPFAPERLVHDAAAAVAAAESVGFPVVAKLCGDTIAHKTERGLVRLGLGDATAVVTATDELLRTARIDDGEVAVLISPMIGGSRELIAGLALDAQFGMTVMLGIGGVLAEAIGDAVVRLVPITALDAHEMLDDLANRSLLGEFRGEPEVDRAAVVEVLTALSDASVCHPELMAVDLNPLIISNGRPVAVDALVELAN